MGLELGQIVGAREGGIDDNVRREYSRNFRYFHRNYDFLMEKFPDEHVVIYNRDVCDHDEDFKVLLERTKKVRNILFCLIGYVCSPETELIL